MQLPFPVMTAKICCCGESPLCSPGAHFTLSISFHLHNSCGVKSITVPFHR